jgi:hypothetical protein
MSRCRSKIARIIAIAGLSVLVASATVPCAAWAKGDHGDGNGGGSAGGGDHNGNGNGNGNGGDHNGNGNGNGGGPAGGGHGGAAANGSGASANVGGGTAANSGVGGAQPNSASAPGTSELHQGADQALASNLMLGRAVVALNATFAVPRPPMHAGLDSRIQQMATYDRAMLHALAMPDRTPAQQATRDRAISRARIQLAVATNRHLNPEAVTRIDSLLGLPASDPTLGVR